MHSLAISLGHNSSAVYIRDGKIIAGYEEERFSGLKADSRFPIASIMELRQRYDLPKDTQVFTGHWFIDGLLPAKNKYWDPDAIKTWFPDGEVHGLSADFTHHDSHLESAMVFAGKFEPSYHAVVADGFGSFGECISVYEVTGQKYRLLNRVFGFEKSMGMLYQYATAFMGMKMHNHEYKMLAYEVHVTKVLQPYEVEILKQMAAEAARNYLRVMHTMRITSDCDPVTKIDALPAVQARINELLSDVLRAFPDKQDEFERRVITSYFVQQVVELVILTTVNMHDPKNLLVVGGLFYNVKLNHLLANAIPGKFCAMPIAGDQGGALGVYQAYQGDLTWPGHLCWGDRHLDFEEDEGLPDGVFMTEGDEETLYRVSEEIENKGFCNLVRGNMEYGPRALCNTSTLAIPDKQVCANVNRMNDRTMEMPFAPVVTKQQADQIFNECDKIHRSLDYMIVTRTYRSGEGERLLGAAHYYPEESVFTGRPQITAEPFMCSLLEKFGPLVNTSFNFHGVPIVRSKSQILDTHIREWRAAPDLQPRTVIQRNTP